MVRFEAVHPTLVAKEFQIHSSLPEQAIVLPYWEFGMSEGCGLAFEVPGLAKFQTSVHEQQLFGYARQLSGRVAGDG